MECRVGCAACCIVISISSPIPGMPEGKKPGERCIHLNEQNRCELFNSPLRPRVCEGFKAEREFCGDTNEQAFEILRKLENSKI